MSAPLRSLPFGLVANGTTNEQTPAPAEIRRQRLERWFQDHFDTLWRLASRLGVQQPNVDDVVQEAFIAADRRAADIAPGCERRFLISTTLKLSANYRRRQRTRAEYTAALARDEPAGNPADPEQLIARKQLCEMLDLALDELPPEQREVLVLHEIEGLSAAEIGELLAIAPGTVASRLARGRNRFSKAAARLRAAWPQLR